MKRQQWGLYAVALAILVVGLVWAGVPASTLLIAALVLVCPLMMMFMMRDGHGGHGHGGNGQQPPHEHYQRTPDQRPNATVTGAQVIGLPVSNRVWINDKRIWPSILCSRCR